MSRFVSADNETESAKSAIIAVVLADLDFSSGFVRIHDGSGTLSFGGNSYLGAGQFAGVDVIDENIDIVARGIKLSLSGVDSTFVVPAMTEVYQNRDVTLYIGFVSQATGALIATPETIWEGRMNQMSFKLDSGSAVVELTCEHRLRREPRIARYTDEDQRLLFSGDRFFDLMYAIPGFISKWGARDTAYGGGGMITPPGDDPRFNYKQK
jgi:hypothetical protein